MPNFDCRPARIFSCHPPHQRTAAQTPEKIPVILDTDIGTDMDDVVALGLILASRELELRGVTTVGSPATDAGLDGLSFSDHDRPASDTRRGRR